MEGDLTGLDEYLTDGFDYLELKVPELRKILQENDIHYPGNAKKSDLRRIYRDTIMPLIPEIIKNKTNERNIKDHDTSSPSSPSSAPTPQKENISYSSSSSASQSPVARNVRTSFSDDSDKDDSMSSNDSLGNIIVQQPTTPNSKKRKLTDPRSHSGTPIVNKVQKKNQSFSTNNNKRISSLPLSGSEIDSESDHDNSISANITNHGKENQNIPKFDFSVNRQTSASDSGEAPNALNFTDSFNIRKTGGVVPTKSYSLIEISDSSNDSGSASDDNILPPAKMKPLIPIIPLKEKYTPVSLTQPEPESHQQTTPVTRRAVPQKEKEISSKKQPTPLKQNSSPMQKPSILPVKQITLVNNKSTPNNKNNVGAEIAHNNPITSDDNPNEIIDIVPEGYDDNAQKNRQVSVDEPIGVPETNLEEEKYEDEEQREEVELDEEEEIAELENELKEQQKEEEQAAIDLDEEIGIGDESDDSIEYRKLHERMDEELQKEKLKEIIAKEDKEESSTKLSNNTSQKPTQGKKSKNKSKSVLKTILKLLLKLVLLILALVSLIIPILLGLWYREQRVSVGYCGFERKCQTFHDIYPTINQLTYVDNALAKYAPSCIPCPENSICYPYMKIRCKPGYALQKSKLNLFGLVPMSDKCVKDDKREMLVKEMVQKSLEFLRTKNAELMCGESDDDVESGISQEDLYNIFSESRAPWIDDDEYEKLWDETLQNLQNEPEIIMRQVNKYIRSKSKKYIGLRCKFEREIYQTYCQYKYRIWWLVFFVTILNYIKYKLKKYFDRKARIVDLTEETLVKLKNNKSKKPPYLSTVQLRDILLSDVQDLKERNNLWGNVTNKLEANNTNIKSSLIEVHGDIMKCWEWIGPVDSENSHISVVEDGENELKK
ncbi:inner nuclear membrane protein enriched at telomere/subtelomere region [Maudiozyma exigua]|uniref:Inner nuclear membrane protein enriched at telomere/subtelomere region n=1 Tax=Maudiozyma exigua TaxID=34358 RepID=A0A9P6WD56_MAUEX|nr:inner nuclear membrane protein enriched at telomere/subtelomere region [Kazachstania exigua]